MDAAFSATCLQRAPCRAGGTRWPPVRAFGSLFSGPATPWIARVSQPLLKSHGDARRPGICGGQQGPVAQMAQAFAVCPPTLHPVCLSPQSSLWQLLQALCSLRAARRWRRRAHWQFLQSITILNPYPHDKNAAGLVFIEGGKALATAGADSQLCFWSPGVDEPHSYEVCPGTSRFLLLPWARLPSIGTRSQELACCFTALDLACWLDAASALMSSSRSGHQMHVVCKNKHCPKACHPIFDGTRLHLSAGGGAGAAAVHIRRRHITRRWRADQAGRPPPPGVPSQYYLSILAWHLTQPLLCSQQSPTRANPPRSA